MSANQAQKPPKRVDPAAHSTMQDVLRHLDSLASQMKTEAEARYWLQESEWLNGQVDALHDQLMASLQEVQRLRNATTQARIDVFERFPQLRHSAAKKKPG